MMADELMTVARRVRFPGKRRLLSRVVPRRGEATACLFGYEVSLDLAEAIQREIYMGTFEPEEVAMVESYLRPGMIVLDIGANVGFFTLMAARAVGPAGRVHAVEPGPYAYRRLEAVLRGNGIAQATVHPIGLGDREGTVDLFEPGAASDNYSPTMVPNAGSQPIAIAVRRLDDSLADWGVTSVDVQKIDAVGYEPRVIEGPGVRWPRGRSGRSTSSSTTSTCGSWTPPPPPSTSR